MVRVLHVLNGLGYGGAETFIMNVYRKINKENIQFDFLIRSNKNNHELIKEIERYGGNVYITSAYPRNFIKNYKETKDFFKNHRYDVVHVHANSLLYLLPLKLAKNMKVPCRIIHSHNTQAFHPFLTFIHKWNRLFIYKLATNYIACGNIAGTWMFKKKFQIIPNAIDLAKFMFNQEVRNDVRKKLKVENNFVVGHIGRFTKQKNHKMVLEIFREIHNLNQSAKLVLIGEGELYSDIQKLVSHYKLENSVIFLGGQDNISEFLQAMDIFVFPSLYEGIPITLLEVQANGLPCIISDQISKEVIVSKNMKEKSLLESPKQWATDALSLNTKRDIEINDLLRNSKYNIENTVKILEDMYIGGSINA